MVGLSDRRASASGNPLTLLTRRRFLKRLSHLGKALFVFSQAPLALAQTSGQGPSSSGPVAIDRASFFGLARVGSILLACGERGLIARSTPESHWQVTRLPTPRNFTALAAHPSGLAVTVGHSGVIFVSEDAGQQWRAVPEAIRRTFNPNQDALLTVAIDAERRVIVGGAFGRMAQSTNLGKSWSAIKPLGDDFEWHIYQLCVDPIRRSWLMVGESGTLAESPDGLTWREMSSPYAGSFFGAVLTSQGTRIVFGMRGRIYRQANPPGTWQPIEVPTTMAWMSGRQLSDGRIMLVGDQGMTAISDNDGQHFRLEKRWDASLSDLMESSDGRLWIAGKAGLKSFESNAGATQRPATGTR